MSLAAPHPDTHLAVHKDVKANPKHLEEMPVVGPILHEVPGKPWGKGEVGGQVMEKHLGWGIPRASGMQGPLEVHEDSSTPPGSRASFQECCTQPSP